MSKQTKYSLFTFSAYLAFYLGLKLLPLAKWIPVFWVAYLIQILGYGGLLVILFVDVHRHLERLPLRPWYRLFLFLPLIIGAASNFVVAPLCHFAIEPGSLTDFLYRIPSTVLCVAIEEILFRWVLIDLFIHVIRPGKAKPLLVILLSALSFSLMHAVNFFGNEPIAVSEQMGYTFGLGLVLGILSFYGERPYLPFVGHLFFNLINQDLTVYLLTIDDSILYILLSLLIALMCLAYLLIVVCFTHTGKQEAEKHGD